MSHASRSHPERLPWFADGQLDADESAAVGRHVDTCPECRAEVEALRSVFRSLRGQSAGDHVPVPRLIAYHDRDRAMPAVERQRIAEHLRSCRDCSGDLATLRAAASTLAPRRTLRFAIVAAAVVIVAVAGLTIGMRRASPAASTTPTAVVFAPVQRGPDPETRVPGRGPWLFEILLPFGEPAAAYAVRIERVDRPAETLLELRVVPDSPSRSLRFTVPDSLRPGTHLLSLVAIGGGDDSTTDTRRFDVEGPR